MTLNELIDADLPWPDKRQQIINYPFTAQEVEDPLGPGQIADPSTNPESMEQVALATASGRLTMDQYREIVAGVRQRYRV
jgi:hypothetical protein